MSELVAIAWPRALDPLLAGGVYLPAAVGVTLIAAGAAAATRSRRGPAPRPRIALAIGRAAVSLGALATLLASYAWVSGWWTAPAAAARPESWQRPALLAIVAAAVGIVPPVAGRWAARPRDLVEGLVLGVAAALFLQPPGAPSHPPGPVLLAVGVGLVHVLAAGAIRRRDARARLDAALPAALAIAFWGAAVVLLESRNARLAVVTAALAAAALGGTAIEVLRPRTARWQGGLPVATAVLPALLVVGAWHDYGDVPLVCFGLLAASPVVGLIAGAAVPAPGRWGRAAIELAAAAAPVALAILYARA